MAAPVNFKTTKFANSVHFVVINIRDDYEAIVATLKKLYETNKNSPDSTDQEHSKDAQRILRQITNKKIFVFVYRSSLTSIICLGCL